jgi:hypothetical protein
MRERLALLTIVGMPRNLPTAVVLGIPAGQAHNRSRYFRKTHYFVIDERMGLANLLYNEELA